MSTEDQNQDFEKLQRLLKLKRHEQPPPRFFNDFSGKVTARIRSGDQGRKGASFDLAAQTSWLHQLWQAIEGKPALSGVFTVAVCGLVVAGMFMADKAPNELPKFTNNEPAKAVERPSLFANSPSAAPTLVSSTNPTAVLPGSLFSNPLMLQTVPVSGKLIPTGSK